MRVLHTADWHLGRTLEGRSRQAEQERFVDELVNLAGQEVVHLVLVAGDIFDTFNPPAWAEELYCEALARLVDGGRRAVVIIAGNHDSPDRVCAVRALAQRAGVTLFGYPDDDPGVSAGTSAAVVRRVASGPGWVELAVPGVAHTAVVLALPYPSESRLKTALASTLDEERLQGHYSDLIAARYADLASHYRPDTVRLASGHIFVAGGAETDSERPIQVGGAYTVLPGAMPPGSQYVALGHLHRPQRLNEAPVYTRYSGSPLAYSFSETGYAKSVTLLDVTPEMTEPLVREIPLSAGTPLVRWRAAGGLADVARWVEEGRDLNAWIDLEIHVSRGLTMDEIQSIRKMHVGIVDIHPVYIQSAEPIVQEESAQPGPDEQFRAFFRQRRGADPADELVRLFLELTNEAAEVEEEVES